MFEIALSLDRDDALPALTEHQPAEFACASPGAARLVLSVDGQELEPFLRPADSTWRWRWNPGPAVGLHRVALAAERPDGGARKRDWQLRVLARKIDQERYEALLDDLERAAYGLAYALSGAGAEGAALERAAPWGASPAEHYYALFEQRFESFERAARRIAARPREHMRGALEQEPLDRATKLSDEALADLPRGPFDPAPAGVAPELQEALRPGGGLLPRDLAASRARPTADIYEHRLLKHLLGLLLRRARFVGALAARVAARLAAAEPYAGGPSVRRARAEQIAAGCAAAERTLRELRALPFLAEVRPLPAFRGATPLLQRDAAYREIYRMWQAQRQQPYLAFDSPLFAIPIADLPRLYEGWCALQVAHALLALGGEVREQRMVARRDPAGDDDLNLGVDLVESAPLLVLARGEWTLTLRYHPKYRPGVAARHDAPLHLASLDRHTRVPDLAIESRRVGEPPRVLLLDAKYRLDADGQGVPQDALADAYTYLGAIGADGRRATLGALLLYPGAGEPERYPSGVGAVPLLPGRAKNLCNLLTDWLPR